MYRLPVSGILGVELPGGGMPVNWSKDVDQALADAKQQNRPILLDFSAAPA